MGRYKDITGQQFGRLTVIEYVGANKSRLAMWKCKCSCGNIITTAGKRLRDGTSKSCGCYRMENISGHGATHKMTGTRIYKEWSLMKYRASSRTWSEADRYANRGITVCSEWKDSFENFAEWALLHGYSDDLSLDRIDNNKGYSPENCRWANRTTQNRNKECNVIIEYNGTKKCLAEWAECLGMNYGTLYSRIFRGKMSIKEAFERPLRK